MTQVIAPAGFTRHQIRPTAAGAELAPVSDPQHRALATAARDGRVYRRRQHPVRVLAALARKGFLALTAHPGSRRANWAYGEITPAGERELARLDRAADEQPARAANATPPRRDPFAIFRDPINDVFDRIDTALAGAQ